ncbi:DNA phosphorothioation system sulfurtransferase DndC [Parashewanella spongiae]|uniref:DNA phosphorothioation system sulfurtransferase DndC n=1 Tax=Parashewanella spongiae TaxID=342950 RepID=A0A3A6UBY4_9GAMM|nr:DNA phosphorothioation system sulfurtransferase DndC [Parashewanella spongiae]MCL1076575.1 DNA phosphorothioation system sulfurtransferase DndC [Parashewanella spongiae]RJY19534.1 DNA phosphorothioation system sulfurtransferase DndC [Parashewanella spongiae]
MAVQIQKKIYSAFNESGFKPTVRNLIDKTKRIYQKDDFPWVIGYSGGKDSTAILQIIWSAVAELKSEGKAHKTVHVISTDTLVENPIVALWVERSLNTMRASAEKQGLPIIPHRLTPKVTDRFWVNLIGRGYPAPRYKFRWCTDRLKISPSNTFIKNIVESNHEAILVLGTRKHESTVRAANMESIEQRADNTRKDDGLNVNTQLDRVWVYTPIEDWTNDDVWVYLTQEKNPWGYKNTDLLGMYQGATDGGECPLVVDKSTQSCGDSRFGCYVCTMVGEDKSMAAMIANDEEKEWMLPLLELRNEIDINDSNPVKKSNKIARDKSNRDFRRMNGRLTTHISMKDFSDAKELVDSEDPYELLAQYEDHTDHKYENLPADIVRGPYRQHFREHMLTKVLEAQQHVIETAPEDVKSIELLTLEDLEEIRRVWVDDKKEIEDSVPLIYEKVMRKPYPGNKRVFNPALSSDVLSKLKAHCKKQQDPDGLKYEQLRGLLAIEDKYKHQLRRAKISDDLESEIDKGAFDSIDEARRFALGRVRNDYAIKLKRLEDVGETEEYLKNISANLIVLNAKRDLYKVKKYKALYDNVIDINTLSKDEYPHAHKVTKALKKLYTYFIRQIDISQNLLTKKDKEQKSEHARALKLSSSKSITVNEIMS